MGAHGSHKLYCIEEGAARKRAASDDEQRDPAKGEKTSAPIEKAGTKNFPRNLVYG